MKVIGITGPTGAGKTTALHVLKDLGAEIIDADLVYHGLLEDSEEMRDTLTAAFGEGILGMDGQVDRKALAAVAYPDRMEELSAITHPYVVEQVEELLEVFDMDGCSLAAIDAIGLIESGLADCCDAVVTVTAPLEVRVRRIMARDGIDEHYARRRALAQKGEDFFRAHADYVLENPEDDPEGFEERAEKLFWGIVHGERSGLDENLPNW